MIKLLFVILLKLITKQQRPIKFKQFLEEKMILLLKLFNNIIKFKLYLEHYKLNHSVYVANIFPENMVVMHY